MKKHTMIDLQPGGGGSFNLLNTIAAVFEIIFRHCGLDPQSHSLRHSEEREQRMKASAYPFNASACISPTEFSLLNKPKAGLLRCITPRNDSKNLSLTRKGLENSSPVKNLVPYYPSVLTTNSTPTPTLPLGEGEGAKRKAAFTLAEVLITLGIIGVVAAMTLPTLIQNYQKRVVETRLQKFYSNINQAVQLAEVQYGDKKIWWENLQGAQLDDDGKPIEGTNEAEKWFNKYLAPNLKIVKRETLSDGTFIVYFPDGSALKQMQQKTNRDWSFFPANPQKCINTFPGGSSSENRNSFGICEFPFIFQPSATTYDWVYHYNKGFEPWKYFWDGTESGLYNYRCAFCGCSQVKRAYCTALIQYNGWKIPDNYPFKVSY